MLQKPSQQLFVGMVFVNLSLPNLEVIKMWGTIRRNRLSPAERQRNRVDFFWRVHLVIEHCRGNKAVAEPTKRMLRLRKNRDAGKGSYYYR